MTSKYDNSDYWVNIHQQFRGSLRSVGWPDLSESYNELKYQSEANSILSTFENIIPAFEKTNRLSILELGVGVGYWTSLLSNYMNSKGVPFDFTCLDISAEALSLVSSRLPGTAVVHADLKTVEPDSFLKKFDVTTAVAVLHHLKNLDHFLNGLRFAARSVKNGGYFILYDPILTKKYSPFDVVDWPSYTGNGMPRRLHLIDDIMQVEGFQRISHYPGVSFVLNGSIEADSQIGYRFTSSVWNYLCKFVYVADNRTKNISKLLLKVDQYLKAKNMAFSASIVVYRKAEAN